MGLAAFAYPSLPPSMGTRAVCLSAGVASAALDVGVQVCKCASVPLRLLPLLWVSAKEPLGHVVNLHRDFEELPCF